jgi:hypothetical protein
MKVLSDSFISTCCGKEINIEEAILNHGMCDICMDNGLEKANIRFYISQCKNVKIKE